MATPLQSYAAYNAGNSVKTLDTEKTNRMNNLKQSYAAQRLGLDNQQRNTAEQTQHDINRFAATNRLEPGSGALLKFRENAQNKQAQDFATQRAAIGGEEAKAQEALQSEIGQRGFQERQLGEQSRQFGAQQGLAMDESNFNRALSVFQAAQAAKGSGFDSADDWENVFGGKSGFLTQLFQGQGVKVPWFTDPRNSK